MADDDSASSGASAVGAAGSRESSDDSKSKKALRKAGESMQKSGQRMSESAYEQDMARSNERSPNSQPPPMQSYKRGGKVRKTGRAKLHKGEVVRKKKSARKRGRL